MFLWKPLFHDPCSRKCQELRTVKIDRSLRKPTGCLIISGINPMYPLLATILNDESLLLIPHGEMQGNDPDKNNMHMQPR
jgi:hypothetical protein